MTGYENYTDEDLIKLEKEMYVSNYNALYQEISKRRKQEREAHEQQK